MPKMQINQDMKAMLDAALERARLQPLGLDEILRKQIGHEYVLNYIDVICKGKLKAIPVETWKKIQKIVSALPDAPQTTGSCGSHAKPKNRRMGYIPLTKEMSQELDTEFERVGLNYKSIVGRCPQEFKKFYKTANISKWRQGGAKSVDKGAWNALLATLRRLPDKQKPSTVIDAEIPVSRRASPKKKYIGQSKQPILTPTKAKYIRKDEGLLPISDDDVEAIRFHRYRTGIPYGKVLEGWTLCPSGLHGRMISSWASRRVKKANPTYIRLVLSVYKVLPDK